MSEFRVIIGSSCCVLAYISWHFFRLNPFILPCKLDWNKTSIFHTPSKGWVLPFSTLSPKHGRKETVRRETGYGKLRKLCWGHRNSVFQVLACVIRQLNIHSNLKQCNFPGFSSFSEMKYEIQANVWLVKNNFSHWFFCPWKISQNVDNLEHFASFHQCYCWCPDYFH